MTKSSDAARWLIAARPRTLPLALSPVLAGVGFAIYQTGEVAVGIALLTLVAAGAIQVGANLYNDAADFERGVDTAERVGPARATASGWFSAAQVKRAAHLSFGLAFLSGLVLVYQGGWPILLIGVASFAGGYAYTGGPKPIAYGPFGELFVLVFFGVVAVAGTYYLQTLTFSLEAAVVGLALGLVAAAVLLLNNYRDLETDRLAGRRTLCHYISRPMARGLYAVFLLAPFLILFAVLGGSKAWQLLFILPWALWLVRRLFETNDGPALNGLLGRTALFQAALTGLLLVGFAQHA